MCCIDVTKNIKNRPQKDDINIEMCLFKLVDNLPMV